jgi:hypothetical protein
MKSDVMFEVKMAHLHGIRANKTVKPEIQFIQA